MTTESTPVDNKANEPAGSHPCHMTVDYRPGRWGRVFHLFDADGREISLHETAAIRLARQVLKVVGKKEK